MTQEPKEGMLFPQDEGSSPKEEEASSTTYRRRGPKPSIIGIEPRSPLTIQQMRALLSNLEEIESATGIRYVQLHLTAKMIIGTRESSGKEFTINLEQLYHAYTHCVRFTSPEVKRHIFMGHSPAVALLRWLKEAATHIK